MAQVSTYLNFENQTEEAFNFYKEVFGTEFEGKINRYGEMPPPAEGQPELPEETKNLIMHMALPILGGHMLMGSDAPAGIGFEVKMGNNVRISLHPDTRAEADKLYNSLKEGGKVEMELAEQFWGDYYGSIIDKYGVGWMIDTEAKE